MSETTAWMTPETTVRVWNHRKYGTREHIAGIEFDDVNVHIGGYAAGTGDAEIVAACNALIAAVDELRKEAIARIVEEEAAHDAADWKVVGGVGEYPPDVPLADPGDHFVGREGQPEFNGAFR
jgi:hypothetical protein